LICFVTWLSKTFERQGRMDIGLYQFRSSVSPPLRRGKTAGVFQSFGSLDYMKEGLNRLVIGVATIAADNFRKRGARLSSPAEL
jgi:hypothetical protein